MHRFPRRLLGLILLLIVSHNALADPFLGEFSAQREGVSWHLSIESGPGGYDGVIIINGEAAPLSGRRFGEQMMGNIGFGDDATGFVARVQGAVLVFSNQQGDRIVFHRD